MGQPAADLQQMKGVGRILAQRLSDAGFDSFEKIADAGEDGLKQVRGISPRSIGSIVEQARQLAGSHPHGHPERDEAVRKQLIDLREKIQTVAQGVRDRFQERLSGKMGKKLTSDLVRIDDALKQLGRGGKKRSERAGKAILKAEKRMAGLDGAGLKKIRKSLKRVRKTVVKAV